MGRSFSVAVGSPLCIAFSRSVTSPASGHMAEFAPAPTWNHTVKCVRLAELKVSPEIHAGAAARRGYSSVRPHQLRVARSRAGKPPRLPEAWVVHRLNGRGWSWDRIPPHQRNSRP